MIKNTFTALIYDIMKVLQENKNFMELDKAAKAKIATESGFFPEEIVEHLSEMGEQTLHTDIKEVLAYASDNEELSKLKSGLARAFANFCVNQIPTHLHQKETGEKAVYKGAFGKHLAVFFASGVEKQIIEQIQNFTAHVYASSFVLVQSPIQLTQEQKKSIRKELSEKYPHSIPSFSVNKKLIGGLRVFVDGKTHDHSWISQINKLTSITNK